METYWIRDNDYYRSPLNVTKHRRYPYQQHDFLVRKNLCINIDLISALNGL